LRPEILFKLFSPITALPGIGPRNAKLVEKLAGPKLIDLAWLLPRELVDRRYSPRVGEAIPGRIATLTVRVENHNAPPNKRQPYRVRCFDGSGFVTLVFFHARADYLEKVMRAYRKGDRKSRAMAAMLDEVSDADIDALAAHYARQKARTVVYVSLPPK